MLKFYSGFIYLGSIITVLQMIKMKAAHITHWRRCQGTQVYRASVARSNFIFWYRTHYELSTFLRTYLYKRLYLVFLTEGYEALWYLFKLSVYYRLNSNPDSIIRILDQSKIKSKIQYSPERGNVVISITATAPLPAEFTAQMLNT